MISWHNIVWPREAEKRTGGGRPEHSSKQSQGTGWFHFPILFPPLLSLTLLFTHQSGHVYVLPWRLLLFVSSTAFCSKEIWLSIWRRSVCAVWFLRIHTQLILSWQIRKLIHSIKHSTVLKSKPVTSFINMNQMAHNTDGFNRRPQDKFYFLVSCPVSHLN